MKSVWRGAVSFGLVNIPVRLYYASQDKELQFHLLHKKDLSRIRYARVCVADGKEIPWEDVVKGYEVEGGRTVVFSDDDFEKANPKKSKTIEISSFASESEIDPIYFEMPYYLEPEKGAAKAYYLFCEALKKANHVAIGTFVFKNHQHLGFIKPYGNVLVLIQLRFLENMLRADELNIPKKEDISKKDVDVAVQFIEKLRQKFNPNDYADTYTQELKTLIKKKGKGVVIKPPKESRPDKPQDNMALLKQSMKETKRKKRI